MSENFQNSLDELIKEISAGGRKSRLLLHSCCGPCSSYCLDYLKDYFKITVFYYNPNIYPESEHDLRLSEQERLIREMNSSLVDEDKIALISPAYDHEEFLKAARGLEGEKEGGARCGRCFELRLSKTAAAAREKGFDFFGTTLTVSPHKNAVLINAIGRDIGAEMWLPSDFKKKDGYKKSIELSKAHNLYRQNYCGCEFSMRQN